MGRIGIKFNRRLLIDRGRLAVDEPVSRRAGDRVPREFKPLRARRARRNRRLRERRKRLCRNRLVFDGGGVPRVDPVPQRDDINAINRARSQVLKLIIGRIRVDFNTSRFWIARLTIANSIADGAVNRVPGKIDLSRSNRVASHLRLSKRRDRLCRNCLVFDGGRIQRLNAVPQRDNINAIDRARSQIGKLIIGRIRVDLNANRFRRASLTIAYSITFGAVNRVPGEIDLPRSNRIASHLRLS